MSNDFSPTSCRKFEDLAAAFQGAVGNPDMNVFRRNISAAGTYARTGEGRSRSGGPVRT